MRLKPYMKLVPGVPFAVVALVWLATLVLPASEAPAPKRVLVLHSYHQGYPFTDQESRGISDVLDRPSNRVEQIAVYMDAKRIPGAGYLPIFREWLRVRLQAMKLQGILVTDNDALLFVVSNRAAMFPGIPVVFSGINDFRDSMLGGQAGITGVVEATDYQETIEAAFMLRPQTRRIVAVTDATTTGQAHLEAIRRIQSKSPFHIEVLSMGDYPMPEFLAKLRGLAPEDAVLLLNHYQDQTGQPFSHEESMELILGACEAPLFVVNEIRLREGVVGGKLVSGVAQGRLAANMLLRIMGGEKVENLPIVTESPNRWVFDYTGLRRWEIARNALPAKSMVVNEPEGFWQRHRAVVVGALMLAFLLTTIIGALTVNITRGRRMEKALTESIRRQTALFESARDAIVIADTATGLILDVNSQAEKLMGRPKSQLVGQHQTVLHPPEDSEKYRAAFRAHVESEVSVAVEAEVLGKDGRKVPVEVNSSVIEIAPGRKVIQGIFRDMTERRRLSEQLRQAQKMEAVGHLAGGVAHDFNNLLTVVQGHLSLLATEEGIPASAKESLHEIDKAAKRATDLTRQLLAFGRRQMMRLAPLDLNVAVENVLRMLRRLIGEQITIETSCAAGELWIEADLVMIEQVITNLTLNARDAMPKGGRLYFRTEVAQIDRAYTQRNQEATVGRFARLTISDTGTGMDTTMVRRIFEPFYTTKEVGRGTGLGLATAYGIIKQHHGWIEVESAMGQGSIFKVHLPLTLKRPDPKAAQAPPKEKATERGPEAALSILLVEDEQAVRELLAKQLRERGHRVVEASTAVEAAAFWAEHQAEIDFLVSDMVMPGGMNGYELACQCRETNPRLPVIIASGYSAQLNLSRPSEEPPILYLAKPFDVNALSVALRKGGAAKL